jgi:hypothetical protein
VDLKGSKTEENLWKAFAGESQARNKYDFFASQAKEPSPCLLLPALAWNVLYN